MEGGKKGKRDEEKKGGKGEGYRKGEREGGEKEDKWMNSKLIT